MKRYSTIALAAAVAVAAGCKDNPVANPIDAPTVDAIAGGANRSTLQLLITGAMAQDRATFNDFPTVQETGIWARDVYRIDASEPRFVQETLGGNPDPGSFAGGRGWNGYYTALRAENNIIGAMKTPVSGEFTAAEISATLGFLRTMKAYEYWRLIELRDTVGVAIQTDDASAVTAIRCKAAVLTYIAALLDSANTDLTAAGGTTVMPFKLPGGFTNFGRNYSVVSNFIRYNRAWKGKVDYYRAIDRSNPTTSLFATAITELTAALGAGAGAVPSSQFQTGVFYNFVAGGSENTPNTLSDSKVGLNPLVKDSVQTGDTRASKIVSRTTLSGFGLTTSITAATAVASTANQQNPLAALRDEELVLLRAQAYIENGDLVNSLLDLNSVRTSYGLAATTFTSKTDAINKVLYEKRYSFLYEGPQRLLDLREYKRLNSTFLRKETSTDPYNAALPIPRGELNARNLTVNPACTP